jgi:hypothetical protein
MGGTDFHRQGGETAEAWLARLKSIDRDALRMIERIDLSHSKDLAERVAKGECPPPAGPRKTGPLPPAPGGELVTTGQTTTLRQAKDAFLRLPQQERQQFALWLANAARAE